METIFFLKNGKITKNKKDAKYYIVRHLDKNGKLIRERLVLIN